VLLHVDPALQPLFEGWPGIKALLRNGDPAPAFDRHVSLASLPLAFGGEGGSLPPPAPQFAPPADRRRLWADRLPQTRCRIGLAWSGNPEHTNDRNRSLPLAALAPIIRRGSYLNVAFVALQTQRRLGDGEALRTLGITDFGEDVRDFGDTAVIAESCDLVISVDTSVAHLAGSLGRPLWVLLPFASDWRWGVSGESTPWYPSARLLRQSAPGDWAGVIAKAAADLNAI
jgi:hypothetical protein